MKRILLPLALCLLLTAPALYAQDPPTDDDRAADMERMERLMEAHEHLMSDSLYHAHMMADTSLQAAVREMMSPEMAEMHAKMMAMPHAERMAMMEEMHDDMMAQMEGAPENFHAYHERMVEAHRRALADPAVRARLMADPEMREWVEELHEGEIMDHDMMDEHHDGMQDHDMMEDGMMEDDTDG
jgi:hypothetical protein